MCTTKRLKLDKHGCKHLTSVFCHMSKNALPFCNTLDERTKTQIVLLSQLRNSHLAETALVLLQALCQMLKNASA
jgi:hypothetical protein